MVKFISFSTLQYSFPCNGPTSHGFSDGSNQSIEPHQPEPVVWNNKNGLAHHELQYCYQPQQQTYNSTSRQVNDEIVHHNHFNQSSGDGDLQPQPVSKDESYQVHQQPEQIEDQIFESSSGHLEYTDQPQTHQTNVSI